MRILHLGALYPPRGFGGAERSVAMLGEAQVRAGHEVTAVSLTPGEFVEEERNGVRVFRVPHESLYWSEDVAEHGPLAFHWRKLMTPFNHRQRGHVERVLDLVRPDIVNTHSLVDVTTSVWTAVARRGIPLVHTLRDYDLLCADGSLYHAGRPCGARCRVMTAAKKRHHRMISAVAANSSETLRLHTDAGLFAHVPEALRRVIWSISGLPDAAPGTALRDGPLTFGYFGRITAEKGVGTLLDAARLLGPDRPFRIHVGGRMGAGTEIFKQAARDLPVTFLGFVDSQSFFAAIDVLVIPSMWAEPLPRSALESYAAGIPVLGSTAGGTPDLIGHDNAEWLFPPGDTAVLACKMQRILAAGRAALPDTASFAPVLRETTEPVVVGRYLDFYRDTLAAAVPTQKILAA